MAGIVATLGITLMMYAVAPLLIGRPMDIAALLGHMLGVEPGVGLMAHLFLGVVVFPLAYAVLAYPRLSGASWRRGLWMGIGLWLAAELIVMPLAGLGVFHAEAGGFLAAFTSLVAHALYGVLLGLTAGRAVPGEHGVEEVGASRQVSHHRWM